MAISLRVSTEDEQLIKQYADIHNMTISEFIRRTVLDKIEDEIDLIAYRNAMKEYKENPQTFTHEEVKKNT